MDLQSLRKLSGLSQFSVAQHSGVSRMRVSLAELGQIPLQSDEEAAVRRVLLSAIRERRDRLDALLANTQSQPAMEAGTVLA